jgi:hypothetical protein
MLQSATDGPDMDACEGNIKCACCCSDYRFEDMVQVNFFGEVPCYLAFGFDLCVLCMMSV